MGNERTVVLLLIVACGPAADAPAADADESSDDGSTTATDASSGPSTQGESSGESGAPTTGGTESDTPSGCGDQLLSEDEACDDGNTEPGDGCDAQCRYESGTVLFSVDVGTPLESVLTLASDDRVGVLTGGTLSKYDLQGNLAWSSSIAPSLPDPPPFGSRTVQMVALEDGAMLVAQVDCGVTSVGACDGWALYSADGTLEWEERLGAESGDLLPRSVHASQAGGLLVTGNIWLGENEARPPVFRRYSVQRSVLWQSPEYVRDFVVGPEGDLAVVDIDEGLAVADLDAGTGELAEPVAIPSHVTAIGRDGAIYSRSSSSTGVQKLSASGEPIWSAEIPLFVASILDVGLGEVVVTGLPSPSRRDAEDDVFVLDAADGEVIRSHALGGGAFVLGGVVDSENLVLSLVSGVSGGPAQLIRFAP